MRSELDGLGGGHDNNVVGERARSESEVLSEGCEDKEAREKEESAALSHLSDSFKGFNGCKEDGELSDLATLNEGCKTQDDFLEAVPELADMCRSDEACDFPFEDCLWGGLSGLTIVIRDEGKDLLCDDGDTCYLFNIMYPVFRHS